MEENLLNTITGGNLTDGYTSMSPYAVAEYTIQNPDFIIMTDAAATSWSVQRDCTSLLKICGEDNQKIVEIKLNGEVVLGEGVTAEFAAHEFWERLSFIGNTTAAKIADLEQQNAGLVKQLSGQEQFTWNRPLAFPYVPPMSAGVVVNPVTFQPVVETPPPQAEIDDMFAAYERAKKAVQ